MALINFQKKLIPLIIANCLDNKILPVYGNGLNIRDWLYVIDHCNAISTLLKKGKPVKHIISAVIMKLKILT